MKNQVTKNQVPKKSPSDMPSVTVTAPLALPPAPPLLSRPASSHPGAHAPLERAMRATLFLSASGARNFSLRQ